VQVKIAVPLEGFGNRLDEIIGMDRRFGWVNLDPKSFAFGQTARIVSTRGVVNDPVAVYFADVTFASAFVAPLVRGAEGRGFW
jgi:hypothetical protein